MTEDPEPSQFAYRWTIPVLPEDHRPDTEVCGICVRSLLPRRAVYKHALPVCRACDSLPNDPVLLSWWMGMPRYKRRAMIVVAFEIDPADYSEAEVQAERTDITEDVDGIPSSVNVKTGNTAFGAGAYVLAVNTYWTLWRDRPGSMHH
jgi:hypothetical protein